MRGLINDSLRRVIGLSLVLLGVVLEVRQRLRIITYRWSQHRLRGQLGVRADTPIHLFGSEIASNIAARAAELGEPAVFAETSGSTGTPKRILYPRRRIARARGIFMDAFARALVRMPFARHSFYVFSSLRQDGSLTSLMLQEKGTPPYFVTLQAPDRLQGHPALRTLATEYGDAALRLWVLALSNPGIIYSTNPSTLSGFFDVLDAHWSDASALARAFALEPSRFSREVRTLSRRLTSRGADARLRAIAESTVPLPLSSFAPAAHTYVCWTGGYVKPFLDRLATHLPADRYRLLPMYSMSTETPETTPVYRGNEVAFVPLADGVLFEFLPAGSDDDAQQLLPASALISGSEYTMVVSDQFGLTRYQTEDVFACVGHVSGLPNLRFLRRRSLSYSFTGEKVTAEQVRIALESVREAYPRLIDQSFLTCVPSIPANGALPRYLLVAVHRAGINGADSLESAARTLDARLAELNEEYAAKRRSNRLGAVGAVAVSQHDFLRRVAPAREASWEAQFKFLPLYRVVWEA